MITKEILIEKYACTEGVEAFAKIYPDGFDLKDWTREKQIELIKSDLRLYFGWAVTHYIVPMWSMSGANLSGASLFGADLSGANLSGASLFGADLSGANLSGASLFGANLFGAKLSGAKLSGANLSGANLSGANLSSASLFGANLSGVEYYKNTKWPKGFDPKAAGAIQK